MDCWSVIGMWILFLRIPCCLVILGIGIMKSFFGADLCDFFLCLFTFNNKMCQIKFCPCSEEIQ